MPRPTRPRSQGCCTQLELAETPARRRAAIPLLHCRILLYQTQESIWRRNIRTNAGRFAIHSDRVTLSLNQSALFATSEAHMCERLPSTHQLVQCRRIARRKAERLFPFRDGLIQPAAILEGIP
jgi:hypothetical protein